MNTSMYIYSYRTKSKIQVAPTYLPTQISSIPKSTTLCTPLQKIHDMSYYLAHGYLLLTLDYLTLCLPLVIPLSYWALFKLIGQFQEPHLRYACYFTLLLIIYKLVPTKTPFVKDRYVRGIIPFYMIYCKESPPTIEAYQHKIAIILKEHIYKYELVVAPNIEDIRNLIRIESELEYKIMYRESIKKYGYKLALLLFGKLLMFLYSLLHLNRKTRKIIRTSKKEDCR